MPYIDIFNGDADGILALHQLRLTNPHKSRLITGVKRDTKLLQHALSTHDSVITVLDISFHANREPLLQLLNQGNTIHYFDHHFAGKIVENSLFHSHIDTSPSVCTSILVDRYLEGKYRLWAVAAAFGDNLHSSALQLAESLKLDLKKTEKLRELGELINYNSYGETIDDLHFSPKTLFMALHPFADPFDFIETSLKLKHLRRGFRSDMRKAGEIHTLRQSSVGRIFLFPNDAWSRRVSGTFINQVARESPELAHAILVERTDGTFLVGVRAPITRPYGADTLCLKFSGGGRLAAAGINHLAPEDIECFFDTFEKQF